MKNEYEVIALYTVCL